MALKGFIEEIDSGIMVGAQDRADGYRGPVALVSHDKKWLHITTDDYEGHAMLNIEALPYLHRALAKIAKRIKAAQRTTAGG